LELELDLAQECKALPVKWLSNGEAVLVKAAEYKAMYPLSIADAWIAACAAEQGAVLLHKGPEFKPLPVTQELLALKAKKIP
jgi:predicted nucleic acid-binding protein